MVRQEEEDKHEAYLAMRLALAAERRERIALLAGDAVAAAEVYEAWLPVILANAEREQE